MASCAPLTGLSVLPAAESDSRKLGSGFAVIYTVLLIFALTTSVPKIICQGPNLSLEPPRMWRASVLANPTPKRLEHGLSSKWFMPTVLFVITGPVPAGSYVILDGF